MRVDPFRGQQPIYRHQAAAKKAMKPGQKLTFSKGVYRVAGKPKPKAKPKPQDPFAGLPTYTPPNQDETMAGANRAAQGIYEPLLADIARRYAEQRSAAMQRQRATAAATQQAYTAAREPLANVYNSAIGQATTLENAVSNRLKGQGESRTADFAAKLAQMGAPETGAAQELATTYQGADAAGFASGMSDVGRLVSRGAEARGWLEKQPGLAAQQSQAELAQALQELMSDENDEVGGITANIPGQVQELFDRMYGQADDRAKGQYEDKWTKIKYLDDQRKQAQEDKIIAREMGNKAAEAAADRELKRIDQEIKMRGQDITVRGQNVTARGQDLTDTRVRDLAPKPGAPKPPKPPTVPQRRVAINSIYNTFLKPNQTGQLKDKFFYANPKHLQSKLVTSINSELKGQGINPNSPEGKAIRQAVLTRLSGRKVAGGTFRWP
jgi:hypothetical protein